MQLVFHMNKANKAQQQRQPTNPLTLIPPLFGGADFAACDANNLAAFASSSFLRRAISSSALISSRIASFFRNSSFNLSLAKVWWSLSCVNNRK